MKSKNITRTFTESIICYTRFAFDNGAVHEIDNDEITVDYAVDEAAAKKVVKNVSNQTCSVLMKFVPPIRSMFAL